ncbi:MAG TPA: hypothetical protein GXX60_06430 [Anaerolineaceae bacterium]|nr:hypothetical protein [Anaerolineaceae bacterium]
MQSFGKRNHKIHIVGEDASENMMIMAQKNLHGGTPAGEVLSINPVQTWSPDHVLAMVRRPWWNVKYAIGIHTARP